MKIPKHITDALGRPRCACPVCKGTVEITASGTIAMHKRYGVSSWSGFKCEGTATNAPKGSVLEWLRATTGEQKRRAEEFRSDAEKATKNAEHCDAMAAELEKVIARESGKGTSK